ncbi:hypothetical protein D9M68_900050 [compost metagenome]
MVLGFLSVVGKRHVAPQARQLDGDRRTERNALVRGAENHVEFDAAFQQGFCIELREPAELGAVIEQAGVEKVRREPPRLGLELAKAQHARVDAELHEILCQSGTFGGVVHRTHFQRHGEILVQTDQPQP